MRNLIDRKLLPKHWIYSVFSMALIFALLAMPLQQMRTTAQNGDGKGTPSELEKGIPGARIDTNDFGIVPGYDFGAARSARAAARPEAVGTDQGSESEPNNTFATADVLTGTDGRIRGTLFSGISAPAATDTDFYSFTTAVAGSKVYAAVINSAAAGQDSLLAVIASDGSTILELDDQDGSFGGSSPSIAGTVLATPGTYYLRVTNFSTTAPSAPYDLYFGVRAPGPTAETEPNNNGAPQALPASQYVNGVVDPLGDTDTFTFTANAGDTVFLSLDLDPERDVTTYNGRIGIGLLGTPPNFLVSSDGGTFDTIDSEAIVMTVKTTGTYQVYTDAQVATAGATQTYNFNVTTIPAAGAGACTTYTNATSTPIADLALTTSTITIPDSRIIRSLRVITDITHPLFTDLDVHLRSPAGTAGNDIGLFTDVGAAAQTGAQNVSLNDDVGLPILFTVLNGAIWRPEGPYRLQWFNGENALGTWSLDIRDDTTANVGTLNIWSLEVCEEAAPVGNLLYNENFEANNGGYTSSGTANEWEYGTPATVGTTTANPVAPFLNCASGTSCWKTDLDNTYDVSSSQDLTSPVLTLNQFIGTINLSWQQRYQMESISFDRIWVRVTEVGNPTHTRMVWHNDNQTMTDGPGNPVVNIPASAGWGRYSADISDFAGDPIQITFHLESDTSINFAGWAIDDVQIRHLGTTAAGVNVGGRVLTSGGRGLSNARVTLTDQNGVVRTAITNGFGYYNFDDVMVGRSYVVATTRKGYNFNPVAFTPQDNIVDLDLVAEP